jgi:hypothetical protein
MGMGIGESIGRGLKLLQESLEEGINFGKKRENFVSVLKYLLVSALAVLAAWILVLILGIIAFLLLGAGISVWALVPIGLVAIVCLVGGKIYAQASGLAAIQYIFSGKKRGYFEKGNLGIAFRWVLFMVAVVAALVALMLVPALISMAGWGGGIMSAVSLAISIIGALLVIAGLLFYVVFAYYAQQELAVKRLGPVEAIKGSMRLVKKNFWETVTFALVIYFLSQVVVGIPMAIGSVGLQIGVGMLALGPLAFLGIILMVLFVLLIMAAAFVVEAGELIIKVGFYRRVAGGKREEEKAEAPKAKPPERVPGEAVIEERIG